ncbi:MAG: oligosaccharide flippase family protein [Methylacidiphilales bacterium]|nr:oligosaccharide flippase family protein [Candidatus Methylacidiphilales bacterium]
MLKNGLYNIIGAVIRVGITFLTIPVIIRLMGIEEYGLWTLVSTVIGIVGLAEGGLSISTTVFLSRDLANEDVKAISQTLTVSLIGMLVLADVAALILWVGAPEITKLFTQLKPSQLAIALPALRYGGFIIWARLLQQIFVAIEQAYQQYGLMNFLNTVQAGLTNIGMIAVAWSGGRTLELMQWHLVVAFGMLVAHTLAAWQSLGKIKPSLVWSSNKGRELIEYSFMTWLTSLGSALFGQCDRLIVGGILGTKLLGIYAGITSITTQINTLSALAVQPLLPKLASLLQNKTTNQLILYKQIKQVQQMNILIAIGLGTGLLIFTPMVFNFIFPGISNQEYTLAFRIAIVIYSLYSLNAVGYYSLLSLGAVKTSTVILISSSLISLLMIYFGATYWGLLGASIGNAGYICTLMCTVLALKYLNIPTQQWICWIQPLDLLLLPMTIFRQKNSK